MAGGIFSSMDKVRPGAYINFEVQAEKGVTLGTRGIATLATELSWGAADSLIELTAADMISGDCLSKIGLMPQDAEALLFNLALQNCNTLKIYKTNRTNGTKASANLNGTTTKATGTVTFTGTAGTTVPSGTKVKTSGNVVFETTAAGTIAVGATTVDIAAAAVNYGTSGNVSANTITTIVDAVENITAVTNNAAFTGGADGLTATAKYIGTFGNKIAIVIKAVGTKYIVETYANGYFVDSQKVSSISELVSNKFVDFAGAGTLAAVSSTLLLGGVDATTSSLVTEYTAYMNLLRSAKWNTMAVPTNDSTVLTNVIEFIQSMRTDEGKYVQAVISDNTNTIDNEGIINNINGVTLGDETSISAIQFTAWVAGATAGADMIESLTGKIVPNAISINGMLSNDDIIDGLKAGKFILSLNQDGGVKVEKDINSLHTFTSTKSYIFSKNRVIRELDEIGTGIENIWETTYMGKVSNNSNGITLFKSSIIDYLITLQNKGAIVDFDSSAVVVERGTDVDSVVASIAVKPVDSMEFLYMTINVNQ